MAHRAPAAALIVIGCLLVPLASVGVWTRREVLDTSSLKNLVDDLLAKQTVRTELADRIVRNLVAPATRVRAPDCGQRRSLHRPDADLQTGVSWRGRDTA